MIPIWGMLIVLYIAWYLVSNTLPARLSISKYFSFLASKLKWIHLPLKSALFNSPFLVDIKPSILHIFSRCSFSLLTILESQIQCQLCDLGKVKLSGSVFKNGNKYVIKNFTPQGCSGNYIRNLHLRRLAGT